MSIHAAQIRAKLNIGSRNVKKAYKGAGLVYSSGSSVTYHVDTGITYREEINEGESCLSPKTFTPAKSGWEFAGWRQDTAAPAAGSVESSVPMGSSPVTLYAVFRKLITVTYYNNSTSASSTSGYRYYNNGNVVNPSFTLTQASSSWTPRGWSTSNQGNAGITYANGTTFTRDSDITLYGLYQQTVTVTYYNNSTTASTTTGTRYWAPAGSINPSFALSQAALSGWTARGWSTGNGATAGITYNNGASFTRDTNVTLYGMYYQTITLTTYNGSSSPTAHNGTRYYCPGSGSVVNPMFTVSAAALSGWSFDGWSTSSGATAGISYSSISGLSLASSLTLYGRYSQVITLSYNGNGASGGSVAAQNSVRYWNSGNVANPTFILSANGFSRSEASFVNWALGSISGTRYAPTASITLSASAVMYAVWTGVSQNLTLINNCIYLYQYENQIAVPEPTLKQLSSSLIDCSLYRGVVINLKQIEASTNHEGTGAYIGVYETGGNFLPLCHIYREWAYVGGAKHTERLVNYGTDTTLLFAQSSGSVHLYIGTQKSPYGAKTYVHGNPFWWFNYIKLLPR